MKSITKYTKVLFVTFLMLGAASFAQEQATVSDEELTQFTTAFQSVQKISMDAQGEMMDVIQASGIEMQRFNELYNESQTTEDNVPASATEEEAKNFKNALDRIESLQPFYEDKMNKAIVAAGMTTERYEEIMMVIQTSPELQQKVQTMMQQ